MQTVSRRARGATRSNWELRRDWAASSGGGTIGRFNAAGLHRRSGAARPALIDQSQGNGWGSDAPTNPDAGDPQPKVVVIELPAAVNVTEVVDQPVQHLR